MVPRGQQADENFMREALAEARRAAEAGEVPVGAVVVREGRIVGRGFNRREGGSDATAHAEIAALREAGQHLGGWRLEDCTLYVTLEPCPMCAGAILMARVPRVVYAAQDAKFGAAGSTIDLLRWNPWHQEVAVTGGVLAEESQELLRNFFKVRRHDPQAPEGAEELPGRMQ